MAVGTLSRAVIAAALTVLAAGCSSGSNTTQSGSTTTMSGSGVPATQSASSSPSSASASASSSSSSSSSSGASGPLESKAPDSISTGPGVREPDDPEGARGAPVRAAVADGSSGATPQSQTAEGQNYWATDWCHYYYSGGTWYGDLCLRSAADAGGRAIPSLYNVYRYPGRGRALGEVVQQLATDVPGYTTVRTPGDPTFRIVHWMRWPANAPPTADNLDFMVTDSVQKQRVWIRAVSLVQQISSGNGPRYGFAAAGGATVGTFPIPDTSQWLHGTISLGDWVAGLGGSLSRRTLEPNCQLPGVTCYRRYN